MILALLAALTASPATLPATMKAARCGDVVTLTAGDYGTVNAPRVACDANPMIVEAGAARLVNLILRATAGIQWNGGRVDGSTSAATAAVTVDGARKVRVAGLTVTGSRVGITAVRSTDIELVGNRLDGVRSDGINVTMVQRALIAGNSCINQHPIRASYDAAGKLLVDGDHADCIQFWTTTGSAPTADLTITGNYMRGETQGITGFNGGQGGYDRIVIENNLIDGLEYWHGITVVEGRGTIIRNNVVRTRAGARMQGYPFAPIKTWISTQGGRDEVVCGNVVEALPSGQGTAACGR